MTAKAMGGETGAAWPAGGTAPPTRRTAPRTLGELLREAAERAPMQRIVHVRAGGEERVQTYGDLADEAACVAGGLAAAGLAPGSPALILCDRSDDFLPAFWGAILAGVVPVPLAPEPEKLLAVWNALERPPVVVCARIAPFLEMGVAQLGMADDARLVRLDALRTASPIPRGYDASPEDLAFLQFSSGSTGTPKGVELTHANLMANLAQMTSAIDVRPGDVALSWMPYFHDMGLIGLHLVPLATGLMQVKLDPLDFAKRPALWLEAAHRHRATHSSAASFALPLVVRRVADDVIARLDLSALRMCIVGAEPISARAWRAFLAKLAPARLDPRAIVPVYGLAEATLGVTCPPLGEVGRAYALDRQALAEGRAVDAPAGVAPDAIVEIMDLGVPLPGVEVRVVDESRRPLEENRVGHVEVRGPNVARGYHRAPEATAEAFVGGWVRTGDLGFLRGGRLCITGRDKDVLIVHGRKFHAHDLEELVAATPGIPAGRIAVTAARDPEADVERAVVFLPWREASWDGLARVVPEVAARVREALGHDAVSVVPIAPGEFPRTTSGKMMRRRLRERYEAGAFSQAEERARALEAAAARGRTSAERVTAFAPVGETAHQSMEGGGAAPGERARGETEAGGAAPGERARGETEAGGAPVGEAAREPMEAGGATAVETASGCMGSDCAVDPGPVPWSRDAIERAIVAIWARVLDRPVETIAPDDRFLRIGGTSLRAMEVLAEMEAIFGLPFDPAILRECATVSELADRVIELASLRPTAIARSAPSVAPSRPERDAGPSGRGRPSDVAIVAMACRFPDADTPERFWENLAAGRDSVREIPAARWRLPDGIACRWGAFLDDVAGFDAPFFGIDPEEARFMDPHGRIFLEVAHEALERAGYAGPRRRRKRIGVFVAVGESGYPELIAPLLASGAPLPPTSIVGNLRNLFAARVASCLDLHGPVLAVDTACSSPLVALHLARRSLESDECDVALVGGVSLLLTPTPYLLLSAAQALSPTGRCRAFSADADGFVPGEGAAALVLERADDARAEGHSVLAIVRGTAVNNDGRSISPMAPNPASQQAVLAEAYAASGIDPGTITYVEAHGTGTPVGDPIEARSLALTYPRPAPGGVRYVGSVKSNVGHLLNAAGMPSLVKVVLSLLHRQLPPSLHHVRPSPRFDLAAAGFTVVDRLLPWTSPRPLRAAINAFGFGGTNAHAILEEGDGHELVRFVGKNAPVLLTLSGRSDTAVRRAAADLVDYLSAHPEVSEADVGASASTARDDREVRAAIVACGDLAEGLRRVAPRRTARRRPRVAFLFAGQGSQVPGRGAALRDAWPAFRQAFDEASAAAGDVLGRPLLSWLAPDSRPEDLAQTEVTQPLLVAFEIALARQLAAWGIEPEAVVGHSVGEIAAACVAGALDLADAVALAAERGRRMQALAEPGAMAAVFAPADEVRAALAGDPDAPTLAAENAPEQVVISGRAASVERACAALAARGMRTAPLRVSHAFHSPLMAPMLDGFSAWLERVRPRPAARPLVSTVTGEWSPRLDAAYFREHVSSTVWFRPAVERLLDAGYDTLVEIGPGTTLGPLARACADARGREIECLSLLGRSDDERRDLLEAIGRLWERGVPLDREALHGKRRRVPVPTYPFERAPYWVPGLEPGRGDPVPPRASAGLLWPRHVGLDGAEWEGRVEGDDPVLAEHQIHGERIVPAAGVWDLVLEAARRSLRAPPAGLAGVTFRAPLCGPFRISLRVGDGGWAFEVREPGRDALLAEGRVLAEAAVPDEPVDLAAIRARMDREIPPEAIYARLGAGGMVHGPTFRRLARVFVGEKEVLAELRAASSAREEGAGAREPAPPGTARLSFRAPASIVDAAMQAAAALFWDDPEADAIHVPFAVDRFETAGDIGSARWSFVRLVETRGREVLRCDVELCDERGVRVARILGLALKRAAGSAPIWSVRWEEAALRGQDAPLASVFVVGERGALGATLEARLCARGVAVARGDFAALAAALRADVSPSAVAVLASGAETFFEIASFARFIAARPPDARPRLVVVTHDTQSTGAGRERIDPSESTTWGLAQALPDEIPGTVVVAVDLASSDDVGARAESVCEELAGSVSAQVAWRGGRRLARRLVEAAPPPGEGPGVERRVTELLNSDTVILLTGGAKGVGAEIARDLAGEGRVLVLVGRSEAAPPGFLEELREKGARVEYRVCDVSRAEEVEGLVDGVLAAHGRLNGVVHAAGVVRPGRLAEKCREDLEAVLAPKVQGARNLAEALRCRGVAPDIFVLFSSVSAVVPGLGGALGDYVAANAFLDAFAAAERAAGRRVTSIAWGPWAEAGMAADPALIAALRAKGVVPLSTRDGVTAFRRVLGLGAAQLVVGRVDAARGPGRPSFGRPAAAPHRRATVPEGGGGAPDAPLATFLRELLAGALGRPAAEVALDESFLSMGLDSLTAVDLVKRVEAHLGRTLPTTLFFEHQTIAELAAYLEGRATAVGTTTAPKDRAAAKVAPPPAAPGNSSSARAVVEGAPDLTAADESAPFPLSPVQLAFYTNHQLHPGVPAYAFVRQTIVGELDLDLLSRSFAFAVARHLMLRVRFGRGADRRTPRQWFGPPHVPLPLDVRTLPSPAALADLEETLCNALFDLDAGPHLRAVVARESPARAHLLLVVHHAVGDAFSLNVLSEDLWAAYAQLARGEAPEPSSAEATFRDHVLLEERERLGGGAARDAAVLVERLARCRTGLRLPWDGEPDGAPAPPLRCLVVETDPALTAALRERSAAHGVSLFHLLLAAYARCLARWGEATDVAVNVARARREARLPGIERAFGPFADTLPVVLTVGDASPFELAEQAREAWLATERHARATSLDLARLLSAPGAAPRTATPASFSFARFPAQRDPRLPVAVVPTGGGTASAATRLGLAGWEADGALRFSWNYPARLFGAKVVERFAREHLEELSRIARAPARPHRRHAPSPLAPLANVRMARGNDHRGSGVGDVIERIRAVCAATPEAIAVDDVTAGLGATAGESAASLGATARESAASLGATAGESAASLGATAGESAAEAARVARPASRLTYGELDRRSDRLAARLVAHGAGPGRFVGLLAGPGADAVVGLVAILKTGAAWVPLDPEHPPARLADALAQTGAQIVLGHAATRARAAELPHVSWVAADALDDAGGSSPPPFAPGRAASPDDVAYVIFTSGSAGRPKGVPILRRSMQNYLEWAVATFGYGPSDRLAATASIAFDASVRQLLAPLLVGATIVPVARELARDPDRLLDLVACARVTVWSSVPSLWERLLAAAEARVRRGRPRPDLSALRWIHVGGEALSAAHVRRWFDLFGDGARLSNLYGPTETTINATYHVVDRRPADEELRVPIGRPVGGAVIRVVADDGRPAGPGEEGELHVGGEGLSPGYLGRPDLTAQAFFVDAEGTRWYRTGDRVRVRTDGALEFVGRRDDQVKVRGHRVELGEIEAILETHPRVARAAVLHRVEDGRERLDAFVQLAAGAQVGPEELRAHVAARAPEYMVPGTIRIVAALPLTPTGKIDRTRLGDAFRAPVPTGVAASSAAGEPPRTPTERRLAALWSELLGGVPVGRESDFFALGGDSLLVLELFARLEGTQPVLPRPTAVYRHRTLAALARALDEAAAVPHAPSVVTAGAAGASLASPAGSASASPAPTQDFPLAPSQRGFLLAEAIAPGASASWLAAFVLEGSLDPDAFQRAVDTLVERHSMLRVVFPRDARPPCQRELACPGRLVVERERLPARDELDARWREERARGFEPERWPLLRLRLFELAPDEHVLFVHAHHLIGDGYSAALLGRELFLAYDRLRRGDPPDLPPLRATFRDHVARLEAEERTPRPEAEDWFRRRFASPYTPPALVGPGGTRAVRHEATLEASAHAALRAAAARRGTTPFAIALTAFYRALVRATGQRDLVVGVAVSGRDGSLPDAHRIFGPFASALPLRLDGRGLSSGDFDADLALVVAELSGAREHALSPGRIARLLPPGASVGTSVGAQLFFTWLDFEAVGVPSSETLSVRWDERRAVLDPPPVGTDLLCAVRPVEGELRIALAGPGRAVDELVLSRIASALIEELAAASASVASAASASSSASAALGPSGASAAASPSGAASVLGPSSVSAPSAVESALIGYLPAPGAIAAMLGAAVLDRESIRRTIFPDGQPRVLETVETRFGRSAFVCLPRFADELGVPGLVEDVVAAARAAARLGARAVSLAGLIPARSAYGFAVVRALQAPGDPTVTTGHAVTAASVVTNLRAALAAVSRDLAAATLAVVGLGSIGRTSLEVLLTAGDRPRRLVLCDAPGNLPRLEALAGELRVRYGLGPVEACDSPEPVYAADVILGAASEPNLLDVDRLRPGVVFVDDSFPPCFDPARAIARMQQRGDLLVVGGGLLSCGPVSRRPADGAPEAVLARIARFRPEGTVASCQLEAILCAARPDLPAVHGLVGVDLVRRYVDVLESAGVAAAPLHLLDFTPSVDWLDSLRLRRKIG